MDKNWKENIYYSIKGFSNLESQKRIWLGLDENLISSFGEDMSLLFDSFCFEEFILECINANLNKEILNELKGLKNMLCAYKRKDSDIEILNDPHWHSITNKAKSVIKLWDEIMPQDTTV